MARKIALLTGVPRAGTTLSCQLLNQRADVVALHEPIDPTKIPQNATNSEAFSLINNKIIKLDYSISTGAAFEHGEKGGLQIDNPVGTNVENGLRQVTAKRGEIKLPPRPFDEYHLVVKQNALFTALLEHLLPHYSVTAIVRNPVPVLLSWMTVQLPVNRGHIPAGERFDPDFAKQLNNQTDCLQRQLAIYRWFLKKFTYYNLPTVSYEELIGSRGSALDNALGFAPISRDPLIAPSRDYSILPETQQVALKKALLGQSFSPFYSADAVAEALDLCLQ
jgi:hypothetical protein